MLSDLATFVQENPLCDTHEHLHSQNEWVHEGPDVLSDLFSNYVTADLHTAGASSHAIKQLTDSGNLDIAGRWAGIRSAWDALRLTGYGEAVRELAERVYGMGEITEDGISRAQQTLDALRVPGGRLKLLRERSRLDHVQIDDFCWPCRPDPEGVDFFLYDLSWVVFCNGKVEPAELHRETGVEVTDLASLRLAQEKLFQKYGRFAIAVKSQHAYNRTLEWQERSDADAEAALTSVLKLRDEAPAADRLCLGDWSWENGVRLAAEHNLPFKIHTGYYAGNWSMDVDRIRPGQMHRLLRKYPNSRFVLMHIAYPYCEELLAVAKHFPNVWVDLCWAWSIDPFASANFVRQFIHTVPVTKLFAFGGDTMWPTSSLAYAFQARKWLTRALEAEVAAGDLSEKQAIKVALQLMQENAYACFDIEGRRSTLKNAAASTPTKRA